MESLLFIVYYIGLNEVFIKITLNCDKCNQKRKVTSDTDTVCTRHYILHSRSYSAVPQQSRQLTYGRAFWQSRQQVRTRITGHIYTHRNIYVIHLYLYLYVG